MPETYYKKRFIANKLVSAYSNCVVYSNTSNIEVTELSLFLDKLSLASIQRIHDKIGSLCLSEKRLRIFIGYDWEKVHKITQMLPSLRKSCNRDPLQAVVIFLLKLKTGSSDNFINAILEVKDHQAISNCVKSVISAFEKDILPKTFGITACSTEDMICKHTSDVVRKLYDIHDQLVLICDGTYIYHQ